MTERHRLPRSALTGLACTSSVLDDLHPVRLSRHLLQLRMLARQAPGGASATAFGECLAALTAVQATAPAATAAGRWVSADAPASRIRLSSRPAKAESPAPTVSTTSTRGGWAEASSTP